VWPLVAVVVAPSCEQACDLGHRGEELDIQAFVPRLGIEALDEAVLRGPLTMSPRHSSLSWPVEGGAGQRRESPALRSAPPLATGGIIQRRSPDKCSRVPASARMRSLP